MNEDNATLRIRIYKLHGVMWKPISDDDCRDKDNETKCVWGGISFCYYDYIKTLLLFISSYSYSSSCPERKRHRDGVPCKFTVFLTRDETRTESSLELVEHVNLTYGDNTTLYGSLVMYCYLPIVLTAH